jgi:hypothetical protein
MTPLEQIESVKKIIQKSNIIKLKNEPFIEIKI